MKNEDIQIRLIVFLVCGVASSGVALVSAFIRRALNDETESPSNSKEAAAVLGAGLFGGLLGAFSIDVVPTEEVKPLQ